MCITEDFASLKQVFSSSSSMTQRFNQPNTIYPSLFLSTSIASSKSIECPNLIIAIHGFLETQFPCEANSHLGIQQCGVASHYSSLYTITSSIGVSVSIICLLCLISASISSSKRITRDLQPKNRTKYTVFVQIFAWVLNSDPKLLL